MKTSEGEKDELEMPAAVELWPDRPAPESDAGDSKKADGPLGSITDEELWRFASPRAGRARPTATVMSCRSRRVAWLAFLLGDATIGHPSG